MYVTYYNNIFNIQIENKIKKVFMKDELDIDIYMYVLISYQDIPVEQLTPKYPSAQIHVYPLSRSSQLPAF
jgi:hypothetical protein